jgi:hypothetical protein
MSGHFDDGDEAVQCMGCGDVHAESRRPSKAADLPEGVVTTCPGCGDGPYRIPQRRLVQIGPTDV